MRLNKDIKTLDKSCEASFFPLDCDSECRLLNKLRKALNWHAVARLTMQIGVDRTSQKELAGIVSVKVERYHPFASMALQRAINLSADAAWNGARRHV